MKPGDKVICVQCSNSWRGLVLGQTYTIRKITMGGERFLLEEFPEESQDFWTWRFIPAVDIKAEDVPTLVDILKI